MKSKIIKHFYLLVIITLTCQYCNQPKNQKEEVTVERINVEDSLLFGLSPESLGEFKFLNAPTTFSVENGILTIQATKGTDYFINPENKEKTATAPFLYKEVTGDFIATAHVKPDFSSMWNAASLMLHIDDDHWIKFAFENSDATGKSIVTVVTKEVSDDANGIVLEEQDDMWLRLIKKGNIYSMLWSKDGMNYKMARLTTLPRHEVVKIGIEGQSPVGESANHQIDYFAIDHTTVTDLRKGE